jgi:predicted metal-binding membrane protein
METATLRRPPALPGLIQIGLIFGLVLFAAISWAVTDDRMDGMDAGPGTQLGDLGWFLGVWVVMMAAMMFPSIAPMVLMFVRIQEGKRERGQETPAGATALFVGGYLVAWAAAGLVGYAIVEGVRSLDLAFLAWDEAGPYVAGGVIVAAAAYQLTPLKDVCLRHCRSPLMFLLNHSHPGRFGALRMGIEHGGFCVGCCWMLMAALFALGVMSIGWMAFIAALIATEKLLPWKALANRGIAVLLAVLGILVAFAPEDVPGLTLPDSPEAAAAMEAMGMEGEEGSMGMEGEEGSMGMEGEEGSMGTEGGAMEEESMGGSGGGAMEEESMGGGSSGQMDDRMP